MTRLPVEMPWTEKNVPHGVIEVNQLCNINCFGCCKDKQNYKKSLDQIKKEIDLLSSKRKLACISLAGGEPLLYPKIEEVIQYISSKNIRSLMLSNASLLTKERAQSLKSAGLDRYVMHIDHGQIKRPDYDINKETTEEDLNSLREKYINICKEVGLDFGVITMLYRNRLNELENVIEFCHKTDRVKFLLLMGYSQEVNLNTKIDGKFQRDDLTVSSQNIMDFLEERYGAKPVFYIPSNKNINDPRWLFYICANTNRNNVSTKYFLEPKARLFFKILPRLQKIIKGRYGFDNPTGVGGAIIVLLLYSLLSFCPLKSFRAIRILFKALINRNLKLVTYCFQMPPNKVDKDNLEICKNCPDITVRNNKLVPTCIADLVEPI